MAFWSRLSQTKLLSLSNQFKRCYFQAQNYTASRPRIGVLERPTSVIHKSQIEFGYYVRFFAAPVQAKPKQKEKDTTGPRLNEKIRAEVVRLVTEEGHGIVSRRDALERARRLNLDLVEVQRNAHPPVCKLADYHKEKYKQQIKEKDRAKSKSDVTLRKGGCKEVRFSVKTEQKDLQMKADTVKRLMDRGYRVKCMAMGTEDQDLGGLLSRLSALIEDVSVVESGPWVEKKQAYVIVRHVKFGPLKKGSVKKISKVASPEVESDASTSPRNPAVLNQSPIQSEDIMNPESEFEKDEEIFSEDGETPIPDNKSATWSTFETNDDFDTMFDIGFETEAGDVQMNPSLNRFSDSMSIPIIEPVTRETVVSSPGKPMTNYPPSKPMDGNSYGIFSASKVNDTPGKNDMPPEANNRYKKGNAFNSRGHTGSRVVSENPNMALSNTNRGGRSGFDNGEQGKWGIFSTESSEVRR